MNQRNFAVPLWLIRVVKAAFEKMLLLLLLSCFSVFVPQYAEESNGKNGKGREEMQRAGQACIPQHILMLCFSFFVFFLFFTCFVLWIP